MTPQANFVTLEFYPSFNETSTPTSEGNTSETLGFHRQPMPAELFWAAVVPRAALSVLGLVLNSLALVSILRFFHHFSSSTRFVINLLVTDLLFSGLVLAEVSMSLVQDFPSSRELCLGFLAGVVCSGTSVQLSLLLALLDNAVAVFLPFRYKAITMGKAANCAIFVVWTYSIVVMIFLPNALNVFHNWRGSPSEECALNRMFTHSFRTLLVVQLGAVTSLLLGVYLSVLRVAHQHRKRMVVQEEDALPERERLKRRDRREDVQCKGFLVLIFLVSWVPFCAVQSLDSHLSPAGFVTATSFATLFLVFNAAANPVVCVWRNRYFKVALMTTLGMSGSPSETSIVIPE